MKANNLALGLVPGEQAHKILAGIRERIAAEVKVSVAHLPAMHWNFSNQYVASLPHHDADFGSFIATFTVFLSSVDEGGDGGELLFLVSFCFPPEKA